MITCKYLPSLVLHDIFLAKHIILNLSSSVDAAHVPNEYSVSTLRCFIHSGIVDHISLIWIDSILCCFIVRDMVDHTSLIWSYRNLCHFIVRAWYGDHTSQPLYHFLRYSEAHSGSPQLYGIAWYLFSIMIQYNNLLHCSILQQPGIHGYTS